MSTMAEPASLKIPVLSTETFGKEIDDLTNGF